MAVRPVHTQDGGIAERRLRPIYDWLDNGNNKKALQEAEKVLKKCNKLQAARALKALALFRLGKIKEAREILEVLITERPSDDATLQAMTISFRESQELNKVCVLYEGAVKEDPQSEELHSHLFMSYVRVADYKSQQRVSMALYKLAPKNPYYFWAVMSIILQAKTTDDPTKKKVCLTLSQRMVENFITEKKMEAEQEARLYIMILELQEKWEEIVNFIESPLYSQIIPGSVAQASIPYLKKLGHWRKLNILCKELLCDNPDRWDYYMPYFDSAFELMKENSSEETTADDTAEKCHEFICQIVESISAGKILRGPYLARLELWKRLSVEGDPASLLGSGVALCVQYLRVFAHKPCSVPDLRPYLSMIQQKEREAKCRDFLTCFGFDENSELDNTDDIQRHISCMTAWRLTAPPLSATEALGLANKLRRHYLRCLKKGLVTATLTEFCSADGYGLLAAHHYFYAAVQEQNSSPIVEALALLELVFHHSPANFHVKLLLVKLYHLIGNASSAEAIHLRLELKHIQLVSLGWIHAARTAAACFPTRALQLLADVRNFHAHHLKDSGEHITFAYKYGTFEKLLNMFAWRERLEACAWSALAARDRALLALAAGPHAPLHAPSKLPEQPTDNRDLNVIVNWDPPQFNDPDLKTRTFDQEVAFLRLKDALVSCIVLCIELADNRPVDEKKPQYEELKICIEAFREAMEKCKDKYNVKERLSISAPFPSRIIAFVNPAIPYSEVYTTVLSMVGEMAVCHSKETHALAEKGATAVCHLNECLEKSIKMNEGEDHGWHMREKLEALSNFLEFIGIITFLLGISKELLTPANAKKSKKKVNQSVDELRTVELLNNLNEVVQRSINFFEKILDEWPQYEFKSVLEDDLEKLHIDDTFNEIVRYKLYSGLNDMVNDVRAVLVKKSKYLKTLNSAFTQGC